jgi:outer membrane protein assembly factor BamB
MMRNMRCFVRSVGVGVFALALGSSLVACGDSGTGQPPDNDVLWSTAAPGLGEPAADVDAVYFGTVQNEVVALDPATGDERWSHRASTVGAFGPIGSDGNSIYVLSDGNRKLGAYDAGTGKELWLIAPPGGVRRFGGLPFAAPDTPFVPTSSALVALKK